MTTKRLFVFYLCQFACGRFHPFANRHVGEGVMFWGLSIRCVYSLLRTRLMISHELLEQSRWNWRRIFVNPYWWFWLDFEGQRSRSQQAVEMVSISDTGWTEYKNHPPLASFFLYHYLLSVVIFLVFIVLVSSLCVLGSLCMLFKRSDAWNAYAFISIWCCEQTQDCRNRSMSRLDNVQDDKTCVLFLCIFCVIVSFSILLLTATLVVLGLISSMSDVAFFVSSGTRNVISGTMESDISFNTGLPQGCDDVV